MFGSNQKKLLIGVIENAPTIAFLSVLQTTGNLRIAGWTGAFAALIMFLGFARNKISHHPILLGINLYILAVTPFIECVIRLGYPTEAEFLVAHTQVGVLLSVLLVGCCQQLLSKSGFIGVTSEPPTLARRLSWVLLAAAAIAVGWSAAFEGNRLLAIAVPLACLFGFRQFLVAGLKDKGVETDASGMLVVAAPGLASAGVAEDAQALV